MKIRDFLEIDYILLLAALILITFGIIFIYSAGASTGGIVFSNEYRRQIIWACAGLILALVLAMFNYRRLYDFSLYLYLGTLVLLIYLIIYGRLFHATRWLRIGPVGVQISEFAKLSTILFLAWFLYNTRREQNSLIRFVISCIIVFVPMFLVLIQPDLGTSLVFIPILLGMGFFAGISLRYIFFLVLTFALSATFLFLPLWQAAIMNNFAPALMMLTNARFIIAGCLAFSAIAAIALFGFLRYHKPHFYWICYGAGIIILSLGISFVAQKMLRGYQIMRLIIFMNPYIDPRGAGWHIIQSITAIGSGGIFGKGFLQGTQSQHRFLPEQSTDFIFSILSEEWGFAGGISVFILFLIINLRLIRIMNLTNDSFGSYIVAGLVSMYSFHFFVNVGMTMGIMPVTGIPLMFVSYGGSALITAMLGIGLALSVHVRRFQR